MLQKLQVVKDTLRLLLAKKKYWLIPLVLMLLLLGIIILLGASTPLGPLIYPFI